MNESKFDEKLARPYITSDLSMYMDASDDFLSRQANTNLDAHLVHSYKPTPNILRSDESQEIFSNNEASGFLNRCELKRMNKLAAIKPAQNQPSFD